MCYVGDNPSIHKPFHILTLGGTVIFHCRVIPKTRKMKKTLLIPVLLVAAISLHAQSTDRPINIDHPVCKSFPAMPANAKPVWPKGPYTALEDPSCPPCYEYVSKHGTLRMECLYLQFPAEHNTPGNGNAAGATAATTTAAVNNEEQSNIVEQNNMVTEETTAPQVAGRREVQMQSEEAYTGNYPAYCKRFPSMPANAIPVWPKGPYKAMEDPNCPPCYEYVSKHGTLRMECFYLQFPAEHERQ